MGRRCVGQRRANGVGGSGGCVHGGWAGPELWVGSGTSRQSKGTRGKGTMAKKYFKGGLRFFKVSKTPEKIKK